MNQKVLVTGISGFLGSHTAIRLLNQGYRVVGTLRDMKRADAIKKVIEPHAPVEHLHFAEADLTDARAWKPLMQGVTYVQHVASPFPQTLPRHENELILPAKNGTLNILRAAAENGVKRVIVTSSIAAIVNGRSKQEKQQKLFDENDWTQLNNPKALTPYYKSKTIAEQAAWDFIAQNNTGLELTTICPSAILGPVLEKDFGTSANLVIKLLDGSTPALPNIGFEIVDVRDVAAQLILAMKKKEAEGERFIASSGYLHMKEIARILKHAYPDIKVPSKVLPDFAVRLLATFDQTIRPVLLDLGVVIKVDHSKAKKSLGWEPLPPEQAVLACAESVLDLGIVKKKSTKSSHYETNA